MNEHTARCADLLYAEAHYLDAQQWDKWLALYLEEAEFWVPAWNGEHELTQDPQSEISLMYYPDRTGLEDRVFRIRTGLSSASSPLPRTSHMIANARAEPLGGDFFVASTWQVTSFRHKTTTTFAGRYEHLLKDTGDGLRIAKKKIIVINDLIPNVMDFYSI